MRRLALYGTVFAVGLGNLAAAAESPKVVTSILPLGSIAAAIMDGVGEPEVLLEPGASPHAYSMKPSQAQALSDADLIVWVGPDMEVFLERPLEALGGAARQLELMAVSGIELLPYREGALFEAHDHDDEHAHDDHDHDDEHAHDDHDHDEEHAHDDHDHDEEHAHDDHDHDEEHGHGEMDAHIWLSPANARVIGAAIAASLGEIDPDHAEIYAANAERFAGALDEVEAEIDGILAPVRDRPFIVFHDAYRYFEQHFDMPAAGAIHLSPEVPPGAARIAEIQARIGELEAACVFAEPQFEPRLIQTVIDGSDAQSAVLDPLGTEIDVGPESYPQLLSNLADSIAECLGD